VVLDGIYAADAKGQLEFFELPPPEDGEVLVARLGGDHIDGDSLEAMTSPRCAAVASTV
jgi:hypothetical protein